MYVAEYDELGANLSRKQEKQFQQAQKKVAKLTPIVAAAPEGKRLGIRRQLTKAQELIARLSATPIPPIGPGGIIGPIPTPVNHTVSIPSGDGGVPQPTPTPVWRDTSAAFPSSTTIEPMPQPSDVMTLATSDTLVSGIPNAFLAIGAIALFMLLPRRRGV